MSVQVVVMLSWFKKRKDRANTAAFVKAVPGILGRYGDLMEKYPTGVIDESWLPVNKLTLKRALKAGWILAADDDAREWIKIGWHFLSFFQPGVGEEPVSYDVFGDVSKENSNNLDRWLRFAKIAQAEDEVNQGELDEFIRQNTSSAPQSDHP